MKQEYATQLSSAFETEAFAARIAAAATAPLCIFLRGQLAAGKTTFARGFVQSRGHTGAVKSPTFTLVESYELAAHTIHHFDLYRITDPEELEYIGLDDYFHGHGDCLVEWPERGFGVLPQPDLDLNFTVVGPVRRLVMRAGSSMGQNILDSFDT